MRWTKQRRQPTAGRHRGSLLGAGVSLFVAIYLLMPPVSASSATPQSSACVGFFGSDLNCSGSVTLTIPGKPATIPPRTKISHTSSNALSTYSLTVPLIERGGRNQGCVSFGTAAQPTAPAADLLSEVHGLTTAWTLQYGLCNPARAALPQTVAVDPAVLAASFWETIPLPAPKPTIPPGYAITGKPAYLVTGGTLDPDPYHQQTVIGSLAITAHGTYHVTWGDGAASGPYDTEGNAWPNGNIAHTYDDTGSYTVTLTETWTATWHLGAATGTLNQLATHATIPAFPVRQLQAVITG